MLLGWLDARQATRVGITLAEQFASRTARGEAANGKARPAPRTQGDPLKELLQSAEREARTLPLNFFKKAKLANAFKWRLLEKGVESTVAAEVTQTLVMHLSMSRLVSTQNRLSSVQELRKPNPPNVPDLLRRADRCMVQGAYAEAIATYQAILEVQPRHTAALNNLGAALSQLGRFKEAEPHLRNAIAAKPNYLDAHINLGAVLRAKGDMAASERSLRRALKLRPSHVEARVSLGLSLLGLARPSDAKPQFEKALKLLPSHAGALLGMGQIAYLEGRFDEAEALYKRVLEVHPNSSSALTGLMGLRKMTRADVAWLEHAEQLIAGGIAPPEEANLRFAIGKYCDEVGDYERAFPSYRRANEIRKANSVGYDSHAHVRFVDDLIRAYSPEALARAGTGASASTKPVLVVGMPRSGTSLVEQIIASHPDAGGAGELDFWHAWVERNEELFRQGPPHESRCKELAEGYLQKLARCSADAARVVDKAPINSDYLGLIHSALPQARIIHVRRHPIDTCLSCYFQQFSSALDFTMDLSDLAHYYRQHHRLVSHWHAALPAQAILNVPYEELVSDQERWTRRIIEFIGLEWDERCLNFHNTKRTVATASAWQVRQKIYKGSIARWHNYEKFLGPLRDLQELA